MKAIAKGIDVSTFQGTIDWNNVKAAGIKFAIIRGGYGRHEKDEKFESNYKNAKKAGVPVGVYHYSYADSIEKAEQEAEFCISYLKGKQLEYPVAFDIEDKTQSILTRERITDIAAAFCERLEKAGFYVCIYSSKSWFTDKFDMRKLSRFDIWVAQWNAECTYKGNYGMWQYSNTGSVNGISGRVDLDYAYKDYPSIIKKAGLNGYKKAAEKPESKPAEKPIKEPESKPAKKPTIKYVKGEKIELKNKPIFSSAYTKVASGTKTGTFYLYDGEKINGRYRITTNKNYCGKKPTYQYVTGWIEL